MSQSETNGGITWAVAQRPLPGQMVSGDACVVEFLDHHILLAVIDGLGHGEEAHQAATLAADSLRHGMPSRGLVALIRACHEDIRGTRGAAVTAALYQPEVGTLNWACVGNVEGVFWHRPGEPDGWRQCVTLRGGVVGYQLPTLQVGTLPVSPGDICCLASDGIASAFVEKTPAYLEPQRLADYTLERYGRQSDDATVLAVRFA